MLTQDLIDLPIEVFGGYTPALAPTVCPPGASPLAQDCDFPEGAVTTRGGLLAIFGPANGIPVNVTINGLKTYLTPQIQRRLMIWDSNGNLYKESPEGVLTNIQQRPQGRGTLYQSSTLFGREYSAYYGYISPALGLDIPRQYDDTNWDRVSQVGPGMAPVVIDDTNSIAIKPGVAGLVNFGAITVTSATEIGNICTLVVPIGSGYVDHGLQVGDTIVVNIAVGGYNGTFTVSGIISPNQIQYINATIGLGPSGGGTVLAYLVNVLTTAPFLFPNTPILAGTKITISSANVGGYNNTWTVRFSNFSITNTIVINVNTPLANGGSGHYFVTGNIGVGLHQCSVSFITRQGFITQPAPPSSWTSVGTIRVNVSNIPKGPSNVIARLLMFTPVITAPAITGTFYSLPNGSIQIPGSAMLIADNVTTNTTIDFTDTVLIAGFNAQYLFTQFELGECASSNGYNNRMTWCGERNKLNNFINLTFDGGWNLGGGIGGSDIPLGWTSDPVNGAGGTRQQGPGSLVDWGDAYTITGDGVTPILGMITQPASMDYLNVSILSINTSYSVRLRLRKSLAVTGANIVVEIFSQSLGSLGSYTIPAAFLSSTQFNEFSGPLMTAQATLPSDIVLRYYVNNAFSAGGTITVDNIEVYPTLQPYNYSTARISHSFNPESYDGTTGAIQIRPNDGQVLHASFPLRNNFYFGKDHYLCYVTDDGVNEPASWAVNEVSATIGICGPNAVDWNEEWAVFAERSGLYIFWGGDPIKITPEIQQDASNTGKITWNSINWDSSQVLWVRIDKVNKQILVGAPVNGATLPNIVFMLDYKWLEGAADIAGSPMVTYSAFTGKVLAHGRGRRWMIWNIAAASMTFAERNDGTIQPFYGNAAGGGGNGKVYQLSPTQYSDDGVAINSFYFTYYAPSHVEEQMVQLGAHQKLLGYLKWKATGNGILAISIITARRITALRGYILSTTPLGDGERGMEIAGERFSIQVGTNAVGSWFSLEQLILCVKKHPTFVVRGLNA